MLLQGMLAIVCTRKREYYVIVVFRKIMRAKPLHLRQENEKAAVFPDTA